MIRQVMSTFKGMPAQSRHHLDAEKESARRKKVIRNIIAGTHSQIDAKRVVDKSRGWASLADQMRQYYSAVRMVVLVRDLRSIVGSIEAKHREHPEVELFPAGLNLVQRCGFWLNRQADGNRQPGLVGSALNQVQEMLWTAPEHTYQIVQCEEFVRFPKKVMNECRAFLDLPPFEHDPTSVEQTATDLDAIYMGKFPHRTEKPDEPVAIKSKNVKAWKKVIPDEIAATIVRENQWYQDHFAWGKST